MQRVLMLSVSVAAMSWAASAVADSPNLKGDYAFTGSATCNVSDAPFDAGTFTPSDMMAWLHSFSVEGIRTFNGDGKGSVNASAMGVNFGSRRTDAGSSVFTFQFTYTVNGDTWTSDMVAGTFSGKITSGGRIGQTFTIDTIPTFVGHISQDAKTLTAATQVPTTPDATFFPQETITYSSLTNNKEYRICNRSRVLINLSKSGRDD